MCILHSISQPVRLFIFLVSTYSYPQVPSRLRNVMHAVVVDKFVKKDQIIQRNTELTFCDNIRWESKNALLTKGIDITVD